MQRLGRQPALDGLRGIAIAAVIGLHFFRVSGGFYGVDLFFVLSGFLITTLLLEEGDAMGSFSLRRFYARRARRLLPALGVLLLASVVLVGAPGGPARLTVRGLLYGGFYLANVAKAFVRPDPVGGTSLTMLWSLAQEEQFYVVWPLVLLCLLRRSRRQVAIALGALFVALVAYRAALALGGASFARLYYSPDTHADGLVLGCAAAFARQLGIRVRSGPAVAALGVFAAAVVLGQQTSVWSALGLPIVEVACVLLVLGVLDGSAPVSRGFSLAPVVSLGALSYSLYLWQGLVLWLTDWQKPLLALGITLVVAIGSYRLVEQPFRRPRFRGSGRLDGVPLAASPASSRQSKAAA